VHDYHLIPLAECLRARNLRNPIGFFLHIPFPAKAVAAAIPGHRELLTQLFAYDLVGLQTRTDLGCFVDYCVHVLGAADLGDGVLSLGPRTMRVAVFPIGIDTDYIADAAAKSGRSPLINGVRNSVGGGDILIGIDRLDYSKGLPQRFDAFDRFLRRHRAERHRPTLLQISPPTRTNVNAYRDIYDEVTSLAGRINARHGEPDWTPIRHIYKSLGRRSVAALLRLSRVGLVTPLRDGMNLVAKEYVAAQNSTDPGVLVLSELAGAAAELDGAILVNPYDPEGVAAAIETALALPLGERLERWHAMMDRLLVDTAERWSQRFLAELGAAAAAARAA
jgi:trehalose 6-phosphate synthase